MTDRAALVDIDGVLADMSPFSSILATDDERTRKWRQFFDHLGEATPMPAGIALVHALVEADIKVRYSTTRPHWTAQATYAWLAAQGLPVGYVYTRDQAEGSPKRRLAPLAVKRSHITILGKQRPGRRLVAFVDDEADIVAGLREGQVPAYLPGELSQVRLAALDVPELVAGPVVPA